MERNENICLQSNKQEENSITEAHSNPLWSVDSRGAGQYKWHKPDIHRNIPGRCWGPYKKSYKNLRTENRESECRAHSNRRSDVTPGDNIC